MDLSNALQRARRGLREERRLYVVAVSSLAVAFLCLGSALIGLVNLDAAADRWGRSGRLTIYLHDDADPQDVVQLQVLLEGLPEVDALKLVDAAQARADFLKDADIAADLSVLPAEAFPASIEVLLLPNVARERADALAARVAKFRAVSDVENYRAWFQRLDQLLLAGRGVAIALAVLVGFCVLAVIGNTIRLAVARRRDEIRVMKLCGATNGFVRGPFVLEGIFQGFTAAAISLGTLFAAYLFLRSYVDATFAVLSGGELLFLGAWTALGLLLGGAFIGGLGSAISVRRYLAV